AARIEGASLTLPLSISRILLADNSSNVRVGRTSYPIPVRLNNRRLFDVGGVENILDGFVQHRGELSIGWLGRHSFQWRPRKTRDHAVIFAQAVIGVFLRITAR